MAISAWLFILSIGKRIKGVPFIKGSFKNQAQEEYSLNIGKHQMFRQRNGKFYLATSESEEIEITQELLAGLKKNFGRRNTLVDYPNVRQPVQVRELFIRIYDQLGYRILRSDESFPNYVLALNDDHGKSLNAHAFVNSGDFISQFAHDECDLVICWNDNLSEPQRFEILELQGKFDLFGHYLDDCE